MASRDGERLLAQVKTALPDSTPSNLHYTLINALKRGDDLNILSFLRAYPGENLTLDLSATANLALQLNATFWQSKVLRPLLTQELAAQDNTPLRLPVNHEPSNPGKTTVYQYIGFLRDRTRQRTLAVDIYYTFNPRGPLVVMSHGFAADRHFLQYLAYHLASHGLTVVSVEHPGSNIHNLASPNQLTVNQIFHPSEFIERPKDISFVLDKLTELNEKNAYLQGKFNTQQVTIIGHSFGGYTAFALAGAELNLKQVRQFCQQLNILGRSPADWLQCAAAELPYRQVKLQDSRIAQVIAFNPIVGNLFGDSLSQVRVPTMILASTEDGITPNIQHQIKPFQQIKGNKYLLVALGGTHMSVTDIRYLNSSMGQSTLVKELMDERANPVRNAAKALSLAFIEQLTEHSSDYQMFLNSDYLNSLSTPTIQLLLTTKISQNLEDWSNIVNLTYEKFVLLQPPPKLPKIIESYRDRLQAMISPKQYQIGVLERIFQNLFG